MVVGAIFLIKSNKTFRNQANSTEGQLAYSSETLENLINKDTDGDSILDWEESLWRTDPTEKETTPGTPDALAIEQIKAENKKNSLPQENSDVENLTETDKFSRELFATLAALNEAGEINQASINALGASLAEKIGNPVGRKIFLASDIKTTRDENLKSFSDYRENLIDIQKMYTVNYTILDVLQEFSKNEDDVDAKVLDKLDPIITQTKKVISAMVKMSVPQSILGPHLKTVNSLQKLSENLDDMKLYETDAVVFLGAVSQYTPNTAELQLNLNNLENSIQQKLGN